MSQSQQKVLEMKFDPNVITHLGIQMYSTLPPALRLPPCRPALAGKNPDHRPRRTAANRINRRLPRLQAA